MYFINSKPMENGNYGNPQSNVFEGAVALPDALLSGYITTKGFATLVVEDKPLDGTSIVWPTVVSVAVNQDALDAYLADHPDIPAVPQPAEEDKLEAQVMYTALMTDTLLEV